MKDLLVAPRGYIGRNFLSLLRRDVVDPETYQRGLPLPESKRYGVLYYFAGVTSNFALSPEATLEANAGLLLRLLTANEFEKIVYLSSIRLYDFFENGAFVYKPWSQRHFFDLSKHFAELSLKSKWGEKAYIFRISSIFGGEGSSSGFLQDILSKVGTGTKSFEFSSQSTVSRDYLHVEALYASIQNCLKGASGGVYDLTSGYLTSNQQIADIFARFGIKIEFNGEQLLNEQALINPSGVFQNVIRGYDINEILKQEIADHLEGKNGHH